MEMRGRYTLSTRPVTTGTHGGEVHSRKFFAHLGKMYWTSFKLVGYSSENMGPSHKILRPSWCSKLCYRQFVMRKVKSTPRACT